jgi:hypothetical protein
VRSLAVVVFGAACTGSLAAQVPAQRPETIALTFAWPADLRADVAAQRIQIRDRLGRADTTVTNVEYRMAVRPYERGLLVAFDSMAVPGADALDPGATLTALLPAYLVSRQGEFLGLHEAARAIAAARALLRPMIDSAVQRVPDSRRLFDAMLTEQMFAQKASEDWNALVGLWVGARLEPGETYVNQSDEPIPLLPGVTIPFDYEFTLTGRLPCREDRPLPECVELKMYNAPDPDSMRTLLAQLAQRIGMQAMASIVFDTLDIENEVTLIAEPGTLRPYWLEVAQTVSGHGREGQGAGESFRQQRRRQYDFAYEPRAALEPHATPDVFRAAAGTWGWARGHNTCARNPHTIAFTPQRDTMIIRYRDDADSTTSRYVISGTTASSIRGALIGEDRRTDAGALVVWDLVMMAPDSYRWHRTDWEPDGYTRSVVRCLPSSAPTR